MSFAYPRGSFNNYVNRILPFFYPHPPARTVFIPECVQKWTDDFVKQGFLLNLTKLYNGPPGSFPLPVLYTTSQFSSWVRRPYKLFIKIKKNPLCTGKQTGLQTNNIEKFPATKMSITHLICTPKSSL